MSQMQRYLTDVLGLNFVIKPSSAAVISLSEDVSLPMAAAPIAAAPVVAAPQPQIKAKPVAPVKPVKKPIAEIPKTISLDKIPDIQIRINPKARILFLVPEKIKKQENEVLHNISKACHPRPVILVNEKQLKSKAYLAELSSSNISHGFCFGAEPFKAVSKDSFFDFFKTQTEAFGLKWLATHSLEKLSDKKSENLTTFKKETWGQLQSLFKETQ